MNKILYKRWFWLQNISIILIVFVKLLASATLSFADDPKTTPYHASAAYIWYWLFEIGAVSIIILDAPPFKKENNE